MSDGVAVFAIRSKLPLRKQLANPDYLCRVLSKIIGSLVAVPQISMALQHEQQRGSHLEAQLEAVSEQLLEAQQALLDEQLRADHLAGQRDSLGRTLQQAQKALHDSERGRPWSADDARQVKASQSPQFFI